MKHQALLINCLLNNIQMPTKVDIRIFCAITKASARQRIHMKNQAFFLRKIKVKI